MATSTYLKADPIKGESTDDKHKEWIEVDSFSCGLAQPMSGPSGTGGRAASRADFQSFCVNKVVDASTVDLNMYCAEGKHIAKLELEVCQETGSKVNYWKYEFENAMVQSVSMSGGGSEKPMENVCFVYDKITFKYTGVTDKGDAGTTVGPKFWSLAENKKG